MLAKCSIQFTESSVCTAYVIMLDHILWSNSYDTVWLLTELRLVTIMKSIITIRRHYFEATWLYNANHARCYTICFSSILGTCKLKPFFNVHCIMYNEAAPTANFYIYMNTYKPFNWKKTIIYIKLRNRPLFGYHAKKYIVLKWSGKIWIHNENIL